MTATDDQHVGDSLRTRALRAWREHAAQAERQRTTLEARRRAEEESRLMAERRDRERRYEADWPRALTVIWPGRDAPEMPHATTADYDHLAQAILHVLPRADPAAIGAAVRFLEADPWFLHSGYRKRDFIRRLTQHDLPGDVAARLRQVVLRRVEHNRGRGLRHYCRLARRVDTPAFRQALRRRLTHSDDGVRRRAAWVLEALDAPEVTPPPGARLSRDSPYRTG